MANEIERGTLLRFWVEDGIRANECLYDPRFVFQMYKGTGGGGLSLIGNVFVFQVSKPT